MNPTTIATIPAHLTTATLVESDKPNAAGRMVISVHATGCKHVNLARSARGAGRQVMDVSDADHPYIQADGPALPGVDGAARYLQSILTGAMDDGSENVDVDTWIVRLSPCAKG